MVGNDTKHSQSITNSVVLISGLSRPRISTKRVVVQTQGTGSLVTGHSHLSDAFGRPTRQVHRLWSLNWTKPDRDSLLEFQAPSSS